MLAGQVGSPEWVCMGYTLWEPGFVSNRLKSTKTSEKCLEWLFDASSMSRRGRLETPFLKCLRHLKRVS